MRILNRPMFRYGGPIKEGVMSGMRSNHANGGTIAGGNQIGMPMGNRTGFADPSTPGFWTKLGGQYNPKNFLSPKKFIQRINPFKKLKTAQKVGKIVKGIPKNLQGVFTRTGTSPGVTGSGAGQQFLKNLGSFPGASKALGWAKKAKDVAFKYPKSTAAGVLYGGVPLAANLPYKKIASTLADVAVPDQIYNWETGRWFNSDDTDLKPSDKKILEEKKTEIIASDKPGNLGTKAWIDPDKAARLAKAAQNKRLKSYLDMMGYDQSKKTAMSDALIDASALVQDATTEAGSIKEADWGKLINKAIQTTSKRLDKPEQIREAVGLMATKAEIEKDLEDPQVKELRALQIEKGKKDLKGLSIGELIPGISKGLGKTRVDAEVMKNVMSVKEPNIIATIVGKKEDLQDIKDASDFTTVEDYIVNEYKGKEGIYIIDNVVVQIDANGVPDRLY